MAQSPERSGVLTGRHVFIALVGFFAIVFAVNAYFIRAALSTHTGVVANEPYRKGLKYNERIAASEQQASLGWKDEIVLAPDGRRLVVTFRDKGGEPVGGLEVSATIGRAATSREDIPLSLRETSAGQYEAPLTLAGEGRYVANIEARTASGPDADVIYRARSRLWLKL